MTLKELSGASGVALATLSRMENGKMTGTLQSHMDICKALEIPLPDLYKDLVTSQKKVALQTKRERTDVFVHDKKATSEILASSITTKKMMPTIIHIRKGGSTHKEETKPGVEKFIYVLDGKVEVIIGEVKYNLGRDDTMYFEASAPHYFKSAAGSESRLICVICPPAL